MSNYIDREVLLENLENSVVISCKTEKAPQMQRVLSKIINCIKDQPTADVAEIVRCKDCKHHGKDETGYWCNKSLNSFKTVEDNFCKFGAIMDKECKQNGNL